MTGHRFCSSVDVANNEPVTSLDKFDNVAKPLTRWLKCERKPYSCEICSAEFRNFSALTFHRNKEHRRKFVCEECDKQFGSAADLKRHQGSHNEVLSGFVCQVCKMTFNVSRSLNIHMSQAHAEKRKLFSCDVCFADFHSSKGLHSHHMQQHLRKIACKDCNKTFGSEADLKKHERMHSGQRPFVCDVCKMAFTQSGSLNRHMSKAHNKVNGPAPAKNCNRTQSPAAFTQRASVLNVTELQNNLLNEITTTAEEVYCLPCAQCDEFFTTISSLQRHMKTSHIESAMRVAVVDVSQQPAQIFQCDKCCLSFQTSFKLDVHMLLEHVG